MDKMAAQGESRDCAYTLKERAIAMVEDLHRLKVERHNAHENFAKVKAEFLKDKQEQQALFKKFKQDKLTELKNETNNLLKNKDARLYYSLDELDQKTWNNDIDFRKDCISDFKNLAMNQKQWEQDVKNIHIKPFEDKINAEIEVKEQELNLWIESQEEKSKECSNELARLDIDLWRDEKLLDIQINMK